MTNANHCALILDTLATKVISKEFDKGREAASCGNQDRMEVKSARQNMLIDTNCGLNGRSILDCS